MGLHYIPGPSDHVGNPSPLVRDIYFLGGDTIATVWLDHANIIMQYGSTMYTLFEKLTRRVEHS